MKIGILSDSHDNIPAITKAVSAFNDAEVGHVIHAGDLVSPFTAKPLNHLKCDFTGVFGNNDGERLGLSHVFNGRIHRAPHNIILAGRKILILHEPDNLSALMKSGEYDAIIYGHTHQVDIRTEKTIVINPGECGGWVNGKRTIAFWDLGTDRVDLLPI